MEFGSYIRCRGGYNKGKEIRTEKKGGRDEGKHREKRGDMEGAKRKKKKLEMHGGEKEGREHMRKKTGGGGERKEILN